MVLKVRVRDGEEWLLIGHIQMVRVKRYFRDPHEPFLENDINAIPKAYLDGESPFDIARCVAFIKNKVTTTVYFEEGYLLGDDGRTIERL